GGDAERGLVGGRVETEYPGHREPGLAGAGAAAGAAGRKPAAEPLCGQRVDPWRLLVAAVVAACEPHHVHRSAVAADRLVVGAGLVEPEERVVLALDEQGGGAHTARPAGRA